MSEYGTGTGSGPGGTTAQAAKDEAAGVARSAAESGKNLAGQAKSEAGEITREAGRQAKEILGRGREEVTGQVSAQQRKLAEGVRSLSDELRTMAGSAEQPGLASDVAHQVASGVEGVASWLEQREPADLVAEVTAFARNRPGTFLAVAFGVGLLAGRLTRGVKDATSDDTGTAGYLEGSGAHRAPGAPSTTAPDRTSAYGAAAGVSAYGTGAATGATGSPYGTGEGSATYGTGAVYGSGTSSEAGAAYASGVGGAATGSGWSDTSSTAGTAGGTPTYGVEGDDQPTQAFTTDSYEGGYTGGTAYESGGVEGAQGYEGDTSLTSDDTALRSEPGWPPVEGEGDRR